MTKQELRAWKHAVWVNVWYNCDPFLELWYGALIDEGK